MNVWNSVLATRRTGHDSQDESVLQAIFTIPRPKIERTNPSREAELTNRAFSSRFLHHPLAIQAVLNRTNPRDDGKPSERTHGTHEVHHPWSPASNCDCVNKVAARRLVEPGEPVAAVTQCEESCIIEGAWGRIVWEAVNVGVRPSDSARPPIRTGTVCPCRGTESEAPLSRVAPQVLRANRFPSGAVRGDGKPTPTSRSSRSARGLTERMPRTAQPTGRRPSGVPRRGIARCLASNSGSSHNRSTIATQAATSRGPGTAAPVEV